MVCSRDCQVDVLWGKREWRLKEGSAMAPVIVLFRVIKSQITSTYVPLLLDGPGEPRLGMSEKT